MSTKSKSPRRAGPPSVSTGQKKAASVAKKSRVTQRCPAANVRAPEYEPTPREQALVDHYLAGKEKGETPRITVEVKDGRIVIYNEHPEQAVGQLLLMDAFASTSFDFADIIIRQLVNIGTQGNIVDSKGVNQALSLVRAVQPRDEVETMLATQMAAVHLATMTSARRLAHVDNLPQQDSASNAFNKLARTFAAQMEALKRYRSKGEQRVYVERVNVQQGGQAIVGAVNHGGEG